MLCVTGEGSRPSMKILMIMGIDQYANLRERHITIFFKINVPEITCVC